MAFERGIDGSEPLRAQPIAAAAGAHEERRARSWRLGSGTLACPRCDAPVSLGGRAVAVTDALQCPYCRHGAPLRDFLSLAVPTRPARVAVRIRPRARVARS
jgi:hypothetical protein